ncbi:branched-chain amino acid aminotransferase [Arsenicicoccus dermatophilus]|uniref:branched-chain amino acid aminotransferase n=1 Tax=Arsenicicoccus dermatophilus TaxID=1076331 RepID=UPI0039172DDD
MTTSSLSFPVERSTSPATEAERQQVLADPGFGKHFTDHMVLATWTRDAGWHDAEVVPYGPLTLDPSTAVFHYGQEIFEGMKAYRHADGSVWTFRPEQNAARFARSAHRLGLPELPQADFLESIRALVDVDQVWVPEHGGESSLYLRPFMIGTESGLGVRPSTHVTYCVIASPAGAYFSGGIKPVSLWVTPQYTRAAPGGTGAAKCGGNYAASLAAQLEAQSQGCDQVVFLDAVERRYIEELGGMNLFFVKRDGTVMTPQLSGSILEGVTRSSILEVARELGHEVEERRISLEEWREGVGSGEITEVFACGTAAVVTPVGRLSWLDGEVVGGSEPGEVTMTIRNQLLDIQTGRAEDTHGWLHRLA